MFSKKRFLKSGKKYDRAFFEKLVRDLKSSGFRSMAMLIPRNSDDSSGKREISEFLNEERNYPSTILIAHDIERQETIKVFFVNKSSKVYFDDNTFPSGDSQPPGIFVQGPDPARVYALFHFFWDMLDEKRGFGLGFMAWFYLVMILIFSEGALRLQQEKFFFESRDPQLFWVDYVVIGVGLISVYKFFKSEQGLYILERESTITRHFRLAVRGELKDNPLVNFLISIISLVVGTLLLKLFGIL